MKQTVKKLYSFLLHDVKIFLAFLIVLTLASVLSSLTPYLYKLLVDAIPLGNYSFLLYLIILVVAFRIISNVLFSASYFLGDMVWIPASKNARIEIFNHVQELDFTFHTEKSTGSLISAFKRGDGAMWSLHFNINIQVVRIVISLLVAVFFFVQLKWWLGLILFATFILNILVSFFLIKMNVRRRKDFNKEEDKVSGVITDNLLNYETVKFFAGEKQEKERLEEFFLDWTKKAWSFVKSFRIIDVTIGTISSLGAFFVLYLSLVRMKKGLMGPGDLVMVASFTSSFYYQFFDLFFKMREIAKNFTDVDRYLSLLDFETKVKDPKKPKRIKNLKGRVVFDEVSFDYPKGKEEALKNFNLKVKSGEVIALVGESGAGKSTVARLLLRLYDPTEGKIEIDGIDLKEMKKNYLREVIGIVPQDPILFNNTIGFNLTFGKKDARRREIKKAMKMANIYEFVKNLPDGLETEVGERGVKLSGGQKQRVAIARMLLTDPKIIIFDEATSSLDSHSEALIQDALWKTAENRTVFIIAHRFSTIMGADRIVVLKEGRIEEIGDHRELVKKGGIYQKLWKLQSESKSEIDFDKL